MAKTGTKRVDEWRKKGGNNHRSLIYDILRKKYGLSAVEANKLKFKSPTTIKEYLRDNDIIQLPLYEGVYSI